MDVFHAPTDFLAEIEKTFGAISITEWVNVFDEWKDRLQRCIDAEGEYLEHDEFDVNFLFTTQEILSGART
jgi:hypothetical protein